MRYDLVIGVTNVAAIALIAFGVHGCASGPDVYGFAVFLGACTVFIPKANP